jgi:uncharacterized protein YjbI with pentapeptide repeats
MANPEHVAIVRQGAGGIRAWRDENPSTQLDLIEANLSRLFLESADLHGAALCRADLIGTQLTNAKLNAADLRDARLVGTNLCGADLREAKLFGTLIRGASLDHADFTGAHCADTLFLDVDVSNVQGLDSTRHIFPSTIGVDTLYRSHGRIPAVFLYNVGVPDNLIEFIKSLTGRALEFYSCFISYSHMDKAFARRLHDTLQGRGIRCWLDEHQLLPGDSIRDRITEGIKVWDKVMFCVSQSSLTSWWVDKELTSAFAKEEQLSKQAGRKVLALIPLNLDGSLFAWQSGWGDEVRSRLAADFTGWEHDSAKFDAEFERVVKALRSDDGARPKPPTPKLGKEKVR